jgi:NitT/TauT family transport system substrate-binding protein
LIGQISIRGIRIAAVSRSDYLEEGVEVMRSRHHVWKVTVAVSVLALGAAACSSGSSSSTTSSSSTPSASSTALQTVNLLFDFTPSPYEAPITWGMAEGIFAKQGIKVNILTAEGSAVSVPEVDQGKVSFGFGDYDVYIGDALKGETGATPVEVYENIPTTGIIAPMPITNLHQLVGKSFGDVADSSGIQLLQYVLRKNGINPSEVPLKLLSFSVLYPEFYQHKIYSAEMDEPGDEDALAEAQSLHVPAYYTPLSNFGLTGYSTVLLANNSLISSDPGLVKRFVTALYESEVQAVASATDADIVTDFQTIAPTKSAADILPAWHDFKTEVTGFGRFNPSVVQSILARVEFEENDTSSSMTASQLFTNQFMPAS